jgi:hypothetical protein
VASPLTFNFGSYAVAQRPRNICRYCSYTWYPRGHDLSRRCPRCGRLNVGIDPTWMATGGGGCGAAVILLSICIWVYCCGGGSKRHAAPGRVAPAQQREQGGRPQQPPARPPLPPAGGRAREGDMAPGPTDTNQGP